MAIDITNQRFGRLIALCPCPNPSSNPRYKHVRYWQCKCACGKEKPIKSAHLINGNTKSCGCLHARTGNSSPFFKGHGEIPMEVFSRIERSARGGTAACRRAKEFSITIEYAWALFLKQDRRCALSNLPIEFGSRLRPNGKRDKDVCLTTASLDRIDSSKGYIKDNVQWVHKTVNIMKNDLTTESFLSLCRAITEHHADRPFPDRPNPVQRSAS